jgi:hypothetical protein
VTHRLPPPGQWNAHREAFLSGLAGLLEREFGREELGRVAESVDGDDARLDFEVARACAEGADDTEIRRLLRGHVWEERLLAAFTRPDDARENGV